VAHLIQQVSRVKKNSQIIDKKKTQNKTGDFPGLDE
jgi:hypothetical protein